MTCFTRLRAPVNPCRKSPNERPSKEQADAKAGFGDSAAGESASEVKALGMRVPENVQRGGALCACKLRTMLHQPPADSSIPAIRFDKQTVEFHLAIATRQHDGEAEHGSALLRYKHSSRFDLAFRNFDRIWVGEYRSPIARIAQ